MNSKNLIDAMRSAGVPLGITLGINNAVTHGLISEQKAHRMLAAWKGEQPKPAAPKPHKPERVAATRPPPADTRTWEERLEALEIFRFGASRAPAQVVKSPEHTAHDSAELRRRMGVDQLVPGTVRTPGKLTLGAPVAVAELSASAETKGPHLPESERIALGLRMGALEVRNDGVEKTPHRLTLGAPTYHRAGSRK